MPLVSKTNKRNEQKAYCPRCGKELSTSDIIGYPYVCFECDENYYEFEVKSKGLASKR